MRARLEKNSRLFAGLEALAVYAASLSIIRIFGSRPWKLPEPIGEVSIPLLVWVYVPLFILLVRRQDPERYGLTLRRLPASFAAAGIACAIVFPAYAIGHWVYASWHLGAHFHRPNLPSLGSILFTNLLLIALPEEVFFRGYLHAELEAALPGGITVLRGKITVGAVLAAALFNVAHVIAGGHWWQGNLPFGVLLGWLRNRTGSLVAPVLVHGLMNVVFELLVACF